MSVCAVTDLLYTQVSQKTKKWLTQYNVPGKHSGMPSCTLRVLSTWMATLKQVQVRLCPGLRRTFHPCTHGSVEGLSNRLERPAMVSL